MTALTEISVHYSKAERIYCGHHGIVLANRSGIRASFFVNAF